MTDTNETKRTRTPRNLDSIKAGALKLPLGDRVDLVKELQSSITAEVETLQAAAKQAAQIANGTGN